VLGVADTLLTVDAATWAKLDDEEKTALVDHELEHVLVRAAKRGFVGLDGDGKADRSARLDDHRRPVLKLRLHDWQLGGFRDVAQRHRSAAIEVQAARRHREPGGQYAWDFGSGRIMPEDALDDRLVAELTDEELLDAMVTGQRKSVVQHLDAADLEAGHGEP